MSKKTILILGGSGAIGSSIAKSLDNGYEPFLISRSLQDLKKLSTELSCKYAAGDVIDIHSIKEIIKKIDNPICGLAYCVGSIKLKPILGATKDDFIESFNVNLISAVECIKLVLDQLISNNGSILLFSTVAVKKGFINHSIISSSKGAVEGLTLALAAELAPKVRVNCIAPSLTISKMSSKLVSNPLISQGIAKKHPISRIGIGDDFGTLGAFLLNNKSSWITGQIIGVDGGRSSIDK